MPDDRRNLNWERLAHDHPFVEAIVTSARGAGAVALEHFRPGEKTSARLRKKSDGSPVTEADLAANLYLEERLRALLPEAGWLSEETVDAGDRIGRDLTFIVDPIDGTRSFAVGNPIWGISVALVFRRRPVIGVVYAPALGETYVAVKNAGARLNDHEIRVSERTGFGAAALVAGPLGFAQRLQESGLEFEVLPKIPSLAVRISKVASGAFDAALVATNSHDWDLAACDLIVAEAGGRLADLYGAAPLYNSTETLHGELVAGPPALLNELIAAARHPAAPEL